MSKRELGKIFVTGSDGFIGSHLVETLIENGFEVTALCQYNSFGKYGWLDDFTHKKCPHNLKLILGDIRDPFFLKKMIKDHDTVFHLAALIAIPYSYVAPQSYFETNVLGTLNVMEACLDSSRVSRFIHTSTSEVYGTAQFVPITEKHPLQGQSPYSASKIGADMAVESYFRSMSLPAVILRPFNTYGPRQSMRAVIPTIISQILSGNSEIKLGNLTTTRDFNYVIDTVKAFIALAESSNDDILGQSFNTGTGQEISIEDIFKLISKMLDKKISIVTEEERKRPEKSEVERLLSDPTKLFQATGWKAKFSLEEGILQLIHWMKNRSDYLQENTRYFV
ncbi:GDP-mannose 4,6-dehydratase [Silvanigrella aquatica]|uniref:NAD-dependent dehydratase n=1 Tax=Silvanigrella aquatica TaxID=1915309 RepID=A0A1L4D4N7_9BACT|nr:GDP-mannose 4,6-dehydratase [Silvanigrella aquatica]APJ05176.1 NAD-dependent dehydratase [Silvanigrella aquatica]